MGLVKLEWRSLIFEESAFHVYPTIKNQRKRLLWTVQKIYHQKFFVLKPIEKASERDKLGFRGVFL